jgi:hypothetical protein
LLLCLLLLLLQWLAPEKLVAVVQFCSTPWARVSVDELTTRDEVPAALITYAAAALGVCCCRGWRQRSSVAVA